MTPAAPATGPAGTGNWRIVALIVASAMLMEQIDATVLATALPTIARDFREPVNNLSVLLTAYILALAIFIPLCGRAADRFGARNTLRSAMLVFMGASLLCAFSQNLTQMAVARFVQGAAGAMMLPVGRLALLRVARKEEIVSATAWLLTPALIGPIFGPPLGGLIVTHLDWRWIFYINLPVAFVGIIAVSIFIDGRRVPTSGRPDIAGFFLCAAGLGALLLGCGAASRPGEGWLAAALMAASGVVAWIYRGHARRTPDPLLDPSVLKDRSFRLSLIGGSLTRICQGAQPFLLPLMFQVGFHMPAAVSGSIVLATALGALLAKPVVLRALRRFGFRRCLIVNGALSALTYAIPAAFSPDWPVPLMMASLVVAGFFTSIQFTSYNTIAYEGIAPDRISRASSFYFTFQQLLLSIGICAGAVAVHVSMLVRGHGDPVAADFQTAFLVVTAISFSALFANLRFAPDAGAAMSGHMLTDDEAAAT